MDSSEKAVALEELKRRYKILDNDRKSLTEKVQGILRGQRAVIDRLKRERDQLRESLAEETVPYSSSNSGTDNSGVSNADKRLTNLKNQEEALIRKEKNLQNKISDLKRLSKGLDLRVSEQRKKLGEMKKNRRDTSAVQRQTEILENRLNRFTIRFNECQTKNAEYKEKINNLRRERYVFDQIYEKLESKLNELQGEMSNIIREANENYDKRNECQEELRKAKEEVSREMQSFDKEWNELGRLIEQDRKLRELLQFREREERKKKQEMGQDNNFLKKLNEFQTEEKLGQQFATEKVNLYEAAFLKIQEATNVESIEELVSKFIAAEDRNFSLFNFLNDLNSDIEKKGKRIAEMTQELQKLQNKQTILQSQKTSELQSVEHEIELQTQQKAEFENNCVKYGDILQSIKKQLKQYVQDSKRKNGIVPKLENSDTFTGQDIMRLLGVVEQDLSDCMLKQGMLAVPKDLNDQLETKTPQATPDIGSFKNLATPSTHLNLNLPSQNDLSDDEENQAVEEDFTVPLSRKDLKERALKFMSESSKKPLATPSMKQKKRR
eukprot:TRINITY_DN3191_c3_g1_i1.p1 TRINITY_DN3191_c3_g1~~TRINITY_DN3191_c3_g1_i1.p1  ORF type:complete len:552 (+),score=199.52 TRINITY_DN3191_c3_g1_i1:38-1693(+)